MKRTRWMSLLLALCLAAGLAACGTGQEGESSPSPAPSPSETVSSPSSGQESDAPSPEEALIETTLSAMTLEEKVGQMFLARCPEGDAAALAGEYALGGYVLFGRDFAGKTPETVRETIASYQSASQVPMLIAVDEEGGTVTRVSRDPAFRDTPFASPREVYASGGLEGLQEDAREKAKLLLGLGIHVNLAPVCDLSDDPEDFIYDRSLGGDPEKVGECVSAMVTAMDEMGLGSTLKHFPGYGSNVDTHTGIARDDRPYETFVQRDFVPFQAGIAAGADSVLVSHNIVACMDEDMPASLSPEVHRVLREELGFDGVVITDDLVMDAIGDFTDGETAAVLAVEAGNDLLCCTDFETQLPAVVAAVESGRISEERIDDSVRRILRWKLELGILTAES